MPHTAAMKEQLAQTLSQRIRASGMSIGTASLRTGLERDAIKKILKGELADVSLSHIVGGLDHLDVPYSTSHT